MNREDKRDIIKEECGVFGITGSVNASSDVYFALYALQHRGQESSGIASSDGSEVFLKKDMGLVSEIFSADVLDHLKGDCAIGHVRYSTEGGSYAANAQPFYAGFLGGYAALAHNGNLVNAKALRDKLSGSGTVFATDTDTEVILKLYAIYNAATGNPLDAIMKTMGDIKGSYSLVVMTDKYLVGVRDPYGIRPLCIGRKGKSVILASESCAVDAAGGEFIRDVDPGEIVVIDKKTGQMNSLYVKSTASMLCLFEYIYFARPDSVIDNAGVYASRFNAGRFLAREHPVDADLVFGVPDSGIAAAMGYSEESKIPFGYGLMKNIYVGRTFIKPGRDERQAAVNVKFNVLKPEIEGKKVIMVDDSIVRGTTTARLVNLLKSAGAVQVHVRISSPPVIHTCNLGIDTPDHDELVASSSNINEIKNMINADSLGYLSLESMLKAPGDCRLKFCRACFDGAYPKF